MNKRTVSGAAVAAASVDGRTPRYVERRCDGAALLGRSSVVVVQRRSIIPPFIISETRCTERCPILGLIDPTQLKNASMFPVPVVK